MSWVMPTAFVTRSSVTVAQNIGIKVSYLLKECENDLCEQFNSKSFSIFSLRERGMKYRPYNSS